MPLLFRVLPLAVLSLAACNAIFGIAPGVSETTGGGTSSTSMGGRTTTSTATGGTGTTSTISTSTSTTTGTGGGAPCTPAGTATCNGKVLQVCDGTGHAAAPVTCDAVAACDAAAQKCNDLASYGRLGVGSGRVCVIEDDRSVECWGDNGNRTLVYGDPIDQIRQAEAVSGVVQARQVSVTRDHQCVLQDDGTVTCWGDNGRGQLGSMQPTPQAPATVPALAGVVEVRTGPGCTCARLFDGSIQCFGNPQYGCLGTASQALGAQPNPTPIGVTGAVALRMGWNTPSCALLASGGVTCWNDQIVPTKVPGVTSALEVAVGWDHIFIRDATGVSWSEAVTNSSGVQTGWQAPTPLTTGKPLTTITGGDDFCGLRNDGLLTCTRIYYTDPPSNPSVLAMQPAGTVVEIASGDGLTYFTGLDCLRLAGPVAESVYCWGDDVAGALGIGAPEDVLTPASPTLSKPAATLTTADRSTTAVFTDGTAAFWGSAGALSSSQTSTPAALGFLGNDNVVIRTLDIQGRAYAVKKSGALVLLSNAMAVPNARLNLSTFSDFVDAYTFWHWDVGLRSGGTVVVYAEPADPPNPADGNNAGVFGNGTTTTTGNVAVTVPGITAATALAAYGQEYNPGQAHVCVIQSPGTVWCWGSNNSGELGIGTSGVVVPTPTQVTLPSGEAAVSIAAGYAFTCVSTKLHNVYCWGDNTWGQIAQTQGGNFVAPTKITGLSTALGVTASSDHACAWLQDGTVQCWGRNTFGQLGDGTFDVPTHPVVVKNVTGAVQASAGFDHTCARLTSGAVTCWGSSYYGQVGTGKTGMYATPQAVIGL